MTTHENTPTTHTHTQQITKLCRRNQCGPLAGPWGPASSSLRELVDVSFWPQLPLKKHPWDRGVARSPHPAPSLSEQNHRLGDIRTETDGGLVTGLGRPSACPTPCPDMPTQPRTPGGAGGSAEPRTDPRAHGLHPWKSRVPRGHLVDPNSAFSNQCNCFRAATSSKLLTRFTKWVHSSQVSCSHQKPAFQPPPLLVKPDRPIRRPRQERLQTASPDAQAAACQRAQTPRGQRVSHPPTPAFTLTHPHSHRCTHTPIRTLTLTLTHTETYTDTLTHTCIHKYTPHPYKCARPHRHAHLHLHTCASAHPHSLPVRLEPFRQLVYVDA